MNENGGDTGGGAGRKIIECVPNFSEGRDKEIIRLITDEIRCVDGAVLLDVAPGAATNRTVVTFAGGPEPVVEAAFRAVKKAAELIDMRKHKGEHPRFGAADVCPLIPITGISMEETAEYARRLAERVGRELTIPVYCYEYAAFFERRRNLASVRAGEYEGLKEKLADPAWKPDYGPSQINPKTGALAIGARKPLIAYNVNLNTTSVKLAREVACDVREKGRVVRDVDGVEVHVPGTLKSVKGIGWYIDEYDMCQVSLNLTDTEAAPIHAAFDEVCGKAGERGLRVTGSELVGLVPLKEMLATGKYYFGKQNRSAGVPDGELIRIAVLSMGLDNLKPFNPKEKIIEYALEAAERGGRTRGKEKLKNFTVEGFVDETSSESPAPGGGSIAALAGALGAALGTMVANLSAAKKGWEGRFKEFSGWAETGRKHIDDLVRLMDEDTAAFNAIMEAYAMPKRTDTEKMARAEAIEKETKRAAAVPFQVMGISLDSMELLTAMAESGNQSSITDAGVGALCARTAVSGAFMNVRINLRDLKDRTFAEKLLEEGRRIEKEALEKERRIVRLVEDALKA